MSLSERLGINIQTEENSQKKAKLETVDSRESYNEAKRDIQNKVIEELATESNMDNESPENIKKEVYEIINKQIESAHLDISKYQRNEAMKEILDDMLGFGPITPLLKDSSVSEVMVNGPSNVFCERNGKLVKTDVSFNNNEHILNVIERIVAPLGRRIDESSPMVDARLPDGSRVNAIIPPLAIDGPSITIRKFAEDPIGVDDLISFGTISQQAVAFIKACVTGRLNVVVSGGTGSGKTTTLNALSSFIPDDDRIVTIEDAAELQLRQPHIVRLETRPPNIEGTGQVTIRDLVKNSLRMRPDRIIVGECRSGEALDMLQAMNTGHDGSLTTGHANTPRDMLSRLETMVLMAGMDLPIKAIREQIASAIDVIIQQARLRDGSRKIINITEVQGMEGDIIVMQDIMKFVQTGYDNRGRIIGEFKFSGIQPSFINKLENEGVHMPAELYTPS